MMNAEERRVAARLERRETEYEEKGVEKGSRVGKEGGRAEEGGHFRRSRVVKGVHDEIVTKNVGAEMSGRRAAGRSEQGGSAGSAERKSKPSR